MAEDLRFFVGLPVVDGDTRATGFSCEIPNADGEPLTDRYLGGIVLERTSIDQPKNAPRLRPTHLVSREARLVNVRQGNPADPRPEDLILAELPNQKPAKYSWRPSPGAKDPYSLALALEFSVDEVCDRAVNDPSLMSFARRAVLNGVVEPPHC